MLMSPWDMLHFVCSTKYSPPHPDPLPQGEGTAGSWLVFSRWSLVKLRHGCDRESVDRSPSPQGRTGGTECNPAHGQIYISSVGFLRSSGSWMSEFVVT